MRVAVRELGRLGGADRDQLDPILDACVAVYVDRLDEDGQVDFKGKAKVFCRTYAFLSSVIPYSNAEWDALTSREQFEARKRAIAIMLKNVMIDTYYSEPDTEGNRTTLAGQGWIVREGKPIAVEITDQDMTELHSDSKTPQAVIRRINKVRTTLDKFPTKLV